MLPLPAADVPAPVTVHWLFDTLPCPFMGSVSNVTPLSATK
jgi:hypothetical protein